LAETIGQVARDKAKLEQDRETSAKIKAIQDKAASDAAADAAAQGTSEGQSILTKAKDALDSHRGDIRGSPQAFADAGVDSQLVDMIHQFFSEHPALNGQMTQEQRALSRKLAELQSEMRNLTFRAQYNRDGH